MPPFPVVFESYFFFCAAEIRGGDRHATKALSLSMAGTEKQTSQLPGIDQPRDFEAV